MSTSASGIASVRDVEPRKDVEICHKRGGSQAEAKRLERAERKRVQAEEEANVNEEEVHSVGRQGRVEINSYLPMHV